MFFKTVTLLLLAGYVLGQFNLPVPVRVDPIGILSPSRPGGLLGGLRPQAPRDDATPPVKEVVPAVAPPVKEVVPAVAAPAVDAAHAEVPTNTTEPPTTKKPTIVKAPPRNV